MIQEEAVIMIQEGAVVIRETAAIREAVSTREAVEMRRRSEAIWRTPPFVLSQTKIMIKFALQPLKL